MAEDSSAEDQTEEPTARRLEKAREEGESARSVEVPATLVTLTGLIFIMFNGDKLAQSVRTLFASGFIFDARIVHDATLLPRHFAEQVGEAFFIILPVLALTLLAAIIGSGLTGGYLFRMQSALPNFGKLNFFSGLKRLIGMRAIVELIKALAKFTIVGAMMVWVINDHMPELMRIESMSAEPATAIALTLIIKSAVIITSSLVLIAFADAVYQRVSFTKKMRMTKQDVRDEMKDSEGSPEIRAQIKRRQREMANARMMERVKDADVVITNPEHFSVALAYDPSSDGAPILLAKGANEIAMRIREEAKNAGVHMFPAPPLARALYFTTKVDHPIPEELYQATAQVIAYVFNLNSFQPGVPPRPRPAIQVPPAWEFDSEGRRATDIMNS